MKQRSQSYCWATAHRFKSKEGYIYMQAEFRVFPICESQVREHKWPQIVC